MMNPTLTAETLRVPKSKLGDSTVPPLLGGKVLQNGLFFDLGEDDELYEGYGTRATSFPYPQQDNYTRRTEMCEEPVLALENDFLKAVFLPRLGGRLWSLWDKTSGRNLVYTNDVIRFSNLASCNAWFSGGVEWNVGIIGHSPFTNRPLYCASLESPEGWPVLRMYEYERVRGVEWQIDFWLRPASRALNCRMRLTNESDQVIPMYWWSNIAVPEYPDGRIIVPADAAYRYKLSGDGAVVDRVSLPEVDGRDITRYGNIHKQVDYFFDLREDAPKYIAHIGAQGFGLMHLSTERLRSRKLFSWGSNNGSDNWQRFLTDKAGRYVEIQAGLAKTQYGCIPMPPHTAWEWMEQYGPVQLDAKQDWEQLRAAANAEAARRLESEALETVLRRTKRVARTPATCFQTGSAYSPLCRKFRRTDARRRLAEHLDYGECSGAMAAWSEFMETGKLHCPAPSEPPDAFFCEEEVFQKLVRSITSNKGNWYATYQLGLMQLTRGDLDGALCSLEESLSCEETPWTLHALACAHVLLGNSRKACALMERGCALRVWDLSYQKEGLRILLSAQDGAAALRVISALPNDIRADTRIQLDEARALSLTGQYDDAWAILARDGGLIPDDIREGDDSLENLWSFVLEKRGSEEKMPDSVRFRSL